VSLTSLMVHDVTIVRAGSTTSRYGDTVRDWSTATETVTKGWVAQQDRSEDLDGREAQDRTFIVYLPASADVTGLDRVEWDGLTLEIVGPPRRAWSPKLRGEHHVELDARLVTG
jgi:hypothetical protein